MRVRGSRDLCASNAYRAMLSCGVVWPERGADLLTFRTGGPAAADGRSRSGITLVLGRFACQDGLFRKSPLSPILRLHEEKRKKKTKKKKKAGPLWRVLCSIASASSGCRSAQGQGLVATCALRLAHRLGAAASFGSVGYCVAPPSGAPTGVPCNCMLTVRLGSSLCALPLRAKRRRFVL